MTGHKTLRKAPARRQTVRRRPGVSPANLKTAPQTERIQQAIREPAPVKNQVQAKASSKQGGAVSPKISNSIQGLRGGGTPLPKSSKAFFEPRFGQDFSKVRLHTDSKAASMADSIQAKAFTLGNDIAFARGAYNPESKSGKQLLAHELTHTVQQGENKGLNKRVLKKAKNSSDLTNRGQKKLPILFHKDLAQLASIKGEGNLAALRDWIDNEAVAFKNYPNISIEGIAYKDEKQGIQLADDRASLLEEYITTRVAIINPMYPPTLKKLVSKIKRGSGKVRVGANLKFDK